MSTNKHPLHLPPESLLGCPHCGSTPEAGFHAANQFCNTCGQGFFDLAGMPCWFPNGLEQKRLWQTLFGLTVQQSRANLEVTELELAQCDLMPQVRERLQRTHQGNSQIVAAFSDLMEQAGLQPEVAPEFAHRDPGSMLQYFELLLRDWAWPEQGGEESENAIELRRVTRALSGSSGLESMGNLLVLGAGAGRLSYDIHTRLKPACTIALDNNPLLIAAAHRLVRLQREWQITEIQSQPQDKFAAQKAWRLQVPDATVDTTTWFALAADAWHAPLQPASFDTVVTPWFIDVNGQDVRDTIALVGKLLKPGGLWVNTGPLLYNKNLPLSQQYTHEEIRTLLRLAGFSLESDNCETSAYLKTPLAAQSRYEQIWTFAARATGTADTATVGKLPAWVVLPHLPIPFLENVAAQEHPVLAHILSLVDGRRSINDLAAIMAPNLGPGQDPVAMMKTVFVQYLLMP